MGDGDLNRVFFFFFNSKDFPRKFLVLEDFRGEGGGGEVKFKE